MPGDHPSKDEDILTKARSEAKNQSRFADVAIGTASFAVQPRSKPH